MDKRFWAILGVIAVIIVGAVWASDHKKTNTPTSSSSQPSNHVEGLGKSGVTLIEYGDYECPICGEYFSTVKQIAAEYSTQIYFQFRNLPLTSIHPNAFAGARAAEAASLQGKFWEMHDELYSNQSAWANGTNPTTFFKQYAQAIGLNVSKFQTDMSSDQVNNTINADLAAFANTKQEQATPTFFLDGKFVSLSNLVDTNGQPSVPKFEAILNAEIASKAPKN